MGFRLCGEPWDLFCCVVDLFLLQSPSGLCPPRCGDMGLRSDVAVSHCRRLCSLAWDTTTRSSKSTYWLSLYHLSPSVTRRDCEPYLGFPHQPFPFLSFIFISPFLAFFQSHAFVPFSDVSNFHRSFKLELSHICRTQNAAKLRIFLHFPQHLPRFWETTKPDQTLSRTFGGPQICVPLQQIPVVLFDIGRSHHSPPQPCAIIHNPLSPYASVP